MTKTIAPYWLGKHHSEETKAKLRKARLLQPDPRLGKKHTVKVKKVLSDKVKRLWKNPVYREHMSKIHLGQFQPKGEKSPYWKGEIADYETYHRRVKNVRGVPRLCELCGTTTAKFFDWANLTGNYYDIYDFKRMCRACHLNFDRQRRKTASP